MRRAVAAAGALLLAVTVSGCGGDDAPSDGGASTAASDTGPRPVTSDESERLAISRFRNYERTLVAFDVVIPTAEGAQVTLAGRADMRAHRAVAAAEASGEPPAYATFAWNFDAVGYLGTQTLPTEAELGRVGTVPAKAWQVHAIDSGEPVDQVLQVLLKLGNDRPDNAQLLRQNGAEWQAATVVDGQDVDVMTAAPQGAGQTLTYYVADDGTLVRVDVDSGTAQPATITFRAADDAAPVAAVPVVSALGPESATQPPATPVS